MDRNNNSSTGIPGDTETPCPCSRHGVISGLCRVGIKYGGYRTAGCRDKSLQHRKQRFISGDHAYHRRYFTKPGLHIHFYDTCSHVSVHVIERNYWKASLWSFSAAVLSYFGIIHAYTLTAAGVTNRFGLGAAGEFAVCYAAVGVLLLMLQLRNRA